jgi:hypothetical protein
MLVTWSAAWHCVAHQIPPWTNICQRLTLWGLKKKNEGKARDSGGNPGGMLESAGT